MRDEGRKKNFIQSIKNGFATKLYGGKSSCQTTLVQRSCTKIFQFFILFYLIQSAEETYSNKLLFKSTNFQISSEHNSNKQGTNLPTIQPFNRSVLH